MKTTNFPLYEHNSFVIVRTSRWIVVVEEEEEEDRQKKKEGNGIIPVNLSNPRNIAIVFCFSGVTNYMRQVKYVINGNIEKPFAYRLVFLRRAVSVVEARTIKRDSRNLVKRSGYKNT